MKNPFSESDLNGFLDRGTEFSGELKFKDLMRIDGKFRGKIQSSNQLVIGETGDVDAEIDVGILSISGKVDGTLRAKNRIEIHAKGRVYGTLVCPTLVIEEGAVFQGKCEMESAGREQVSGSLIQMTREKK